MKILFNKTEQENFLALIKETTSVDLSLADVDIGVPEAHTDTVVVDTANPNKDPLGHNTTVRLTAKATSATYKGSHALNYRRIDLQTQWFITNDVATVLYTDTTMPVFDEAHIKEYIVTRCPLKADSVTVNIQVSGTTAAVTITPISDSLLYTGQLELSFKPKPKEKLDLATVIGSTDLRGYEYETDVSLPTTALHGFIYPPKSNS